MSDLETSHVANRRLSGAAGLFLLLVFITIQATHHHRFVPTPPSDFQIESVGGSAVLPCVGCLVDRQVVDFALRLAIQTPNTDTLAFPAPSSSLPSLVAMDPLSRGPPQA